MEEGRTNKDQIPKRTNTPEESEQNLALWLNTYGSFQSALQELDESAKTGIEKIEAWRKKRAASQNHNSSTAHDTQPNEGQPAPTNDRRLLK